MEEARANTGWSLKTAQKIRTTDPLTKRELSILRRQLDPKGIYLKSGG